MEKLKFGLFSVVVLSLIGLMWYWSVSTIESGSEYKASEQIVTLKKENEDLKNKVSSLSSELALVKNSATPVTTDTKTTTTPTPTTEVKDTKPATTTNKNQSLINELQKLVDQNITLKSKSTGTRVGTVQKFLNVYNNTSTKIDNDYGATTVKLVSDFQTKEGITVSGEVGATTLKKMIEWLKDN